MLNKCHRILLKLVEWNSFTVCSGGDFRQYVLEKEVGPVLQYAQEVILDGTYLRRKLGQIYISAVKSNRI
jgi:hypothetical protein